MDTNISHFRVLTNIFCFRNILVRLFHFSDNDFGKMDISEKDIGKIKYPNIQKDYIFVHQENGKNHISCSEKNHEKINDTNFQLVSGQRSRKLVAKIGRFFPLLYTSNLFSFTFSSSY